MTISPFRAVLLIFALLCPFDLAAQTVSPILQPQQHFIDTSAGGVPCAGCSLYSYLAGTTTPTPTYTDSTGIPQNTNPIVLDTSGSAAIWLKNSLFYKFVLENALGTTLWTVDNVPGSQGLGIYLPITGGSVASLNQTVYADQQAGSTADAKIMAACALLPSGGIVDATGFGATTQTIASTVTCGSTAAPITIRFSVATSFIPNSSGTNMFALVDGMSIEGSLYANVSGVSGWSGYVVGTTAGTIIPAAHSSTVSHVARVICYGAGNTTGSCVQLNAHSSSNIDYLDFGSISVQGMLYGVNLNAIESTAGVAGFINANWFHNVNCVATKHCMYLVATGTNSSTAVSENHFPRAQHEMLSVGGLTSIDAVASSGATIRGNDFLGFTPFDAPGSSIINFSSGSSGNQVSGYLCLSSACSSASYTDTPVANSVTDWQVPGQLNTQINVLNATGVSLGTISAATTGPQIVLPGTNRFNIVSGNGGVYLQGGTGADHNTYIESLDASATNMFFAQPLQTSAYLARNATTIGGIQIGQGTSTQIGGISFFPTGVGPSAVATIGNDPIANNTLSINPPSAGLLLLGPMKIESTVSGLLTLEGTNSGAFDPIFSMLGGSNGITQLFSVRPSGTTAVYINTQDSVPLSLGVSSGGPGSTQQDFFIDASHNTHTTNALTVGAEAGQSGQAACYSTSGVLGHCTTAVGAGGACTCTSP